MLFAVAFFAFQLGTGTHFPEITPEDVAVPLPYMEPGALPSDNEESCEPTYENLEPEDAPNPYPYEDENLVS